VTIVLTIQEVDTAAQAQIFRVRECTAAKARQHSA
jgi:hypothetical protein